MNIRGIIEAIKDSVPAAGGAAATSIGGSLAAAPSWLIYVGQVVVIVFFTSRAIDKRLSRLHAAVNEAQGKVETLTGRFNGLACVATPTAGKPEECKKGAA